MKQELQNRLMQFSKDLVTTAQGMTISTINRNSLEKCIEFGTNAGSENVQATGASTKKAFAFKINMTKSCLNTASYRLELLVETSKDKKPELEKLFAEAKDLALIYNRISWKLKKGEATENDKKEEKEEDDK